MTDKKRQYQQNYLTGKAKRGYILKQFFIHNTIMNEVKQFIQRRHKHVELQALQDEIRQETPLATAETSTA